MDDTFRILSKDSMILYSLQHNENLVDVGKKLCYNKKLFLDVNNNNLSQHFSIIY